MESIINLNDDQFSEYLIRNIEKISEEYVLERLFMMQQYKFILLLKKIPTDKLEKLIKMDDMIMKNGLNMIGTIFCNLNDSLKKEMLKNERYFSIILASDKNKFGKSYFDLVDNNIKLEILNYRERLNKIEPQLFYKLLERLKDSDFEKIIINLNEPFLSDKENLYHYISKKTEAEEQLIMSFIVKVTQERRNPYYLIKIKNSVQLLIYDKFNLYMNCYRENDMVVFNDELAVNYDFMKNINERHINYIIEKLSEDNKNIDKTILLMTALKLYSIFGHDNAMKIINNKFTYMTDSALYRAAFNNFIDERRQYRLENQDRFFSQCLLKNAIDAIDSNDLNFFKNICLSEDASYINKFFEKIKEEIKHCDDMKSKKAIIEHYLQMEIKNREDFLEENYIQNYIDNYKSKKNNATPLSCLDIYKYFRDVDISKVRLDENGRVIINESLNNFLLGNYKSNNDCLLRLVFNKEAFGLNDTISVVINNFEKIKRIIDKSKNKLSANSILDIIDICKALFYDLEPNEQDMTLDTVAKILRSHEYCEIPKEEIFLKARELHKKKKEKVCSTIPTISGISEDNIKYSVMNFDDQALITCGIDTGSCFKVGGKGESFLNYCLTSPHAVVVSLIGEDDNLYICPFIRNGNGIYGNGIDPKPTSNEVAEKLVTALSKCANEIIEKSDDNEKIEFAIITDLHLEQFLYNKGIESKQIDEYLPIDGAFYADYGKKDLKNYVIAKTKEDVDLQFYVPKIMYYQKRNPNYIYNVETESDKERIELLINSINYTSIEYSNTSDVMKNSLKRKYKNLSIDDFSCVIGNRDWFVGVNRSMKIYGCILPYDKRAKEEYFKTLANLTEQYCNKEKGEIMTK